MPKRLYGTLVTNICSRAAQMSSDMDIDDQPQRVTVIQPRGRRSAHRRAHRMFVNDSARGSTTDSAGDTHRHAEILRLQLEAMEQIEYHTKRHLTAVYLQFFIFVLLVGIGWMFLHNANDDLVEIRPLLQMADRLRPELERLIKGSADAGDILHTVRQTVNVTDVSLRAVALVELMETALNEFITVGIAIRPNPEP